MKTTLTIFLALLLATSASALGWPKPKITYYNCATRAQLEDHIHTMRQVNEALFVSHATLTGSMLPWIRGGEEREFLVLERYSKQKLTRGLVVSFKRDEKTPRCLHMIADISADGEWIYLTGVNNRYSDGWFNRSKVSAILIEVVTLPALP